MKCMPLNFVNCEIMFVLTDIPAIRCDGKVDFRQFYTIDNFLRPPSLAQSLIKIEKRQFGASGNRRI